MEHRIYMMTYQADAIRRDLESCGLVAERRKFIAISKPHHLDGLREATFIVMRGHPSPVPPEVEERLRHIGATVITIDDTHRRDRFYREQLAQEQAAHG